MLPAFAVIVTQHIHARFAALEIKSEACTGLCLVVGSLPTPVPSELGDGVSVSALCPATHVDGLP